MVIAETASVWRLLSWRRSIFMRPTPKQYTLRSRSSRRPAGDGTAVTLLTVCIDSGSRSTALASTQCRTQGCFAIDSSECKWRCPHAIVLAGEPQDCMGGALRQEVWNGTAGLAAASHTPSATMPEPHSHRDQ